MAIRFSCSSCGKKLAVKIENAGRRSKCPSCGWGLTVPLETLQDENDGDPAEAPATVASSVMPAALRARRIDGDDEPAETIPGATTSAVQPPRVPAAVTVSGMPSSAHRPRTLRAILAVSVAANLALLGLVAYQARPREPAMGDYRDTLLAMKLWPMRDTHPEFGPNEELDAIHRKRRTFYTEMIRSMPPGEKGMGLLVDTSEFFEGDTIDLWVACRSCATELGFESIKIEPMDALDAVHRYAHGAWTRLVQEFNRKQVSARNEFFIPYRGLRRSGLSHAEAIDKLINEKLELGTGS